MNDRATTRHRLAGKVAVVTGGGNGIGRGCCTRFAVEGACVVVADILDAAAKETAAEITGAGGDALALAVDAADQAANDAMIERAVDAFGAVDILVTAAGVSHADYRSGDTERDMASFGSMAQALAEPHRLLLDLELGAWQRVLDINLTGTLLAVQAAAQHMVERGRGGSIITVASIAAKVPEAGPPAYAVSKAGVWMLTKAAARSLAKAGIRVNAIGPGFIETNMTKLLTDMPAVRDLAVAQIPMGRVGRPDEVANVALFLASDEASYVTGEILHPDGGFYTD